MIRIYLGDFPDDDEYPPRCDDCGRFVKWDGSPCACSSVPESPGA